MKKSFKSFRENKDIMEFGKAYDNLCFAIYESRMTFEEFWYKHGLPTFLKGGASNEEELLEGWNPMSWDWKGLGQGIANSAPVQAMKGLGQQAATAAGYAGHQIANSNAGQAVSNFFNPQQPATPAGQTPPPLPGQQPAAQARPELSADATAKAATAMNDIKAAFNKSMQGLVQKYQTNRDSVGYQLAKGFMDKVNSYAEKLKIQRGEGTFDKNAAFGQAQNTGAGQNTGDRWKQMASTPQGKEQMAKTYSQKLGVQPQQIKQLIDAGFTNPSLWAGMLAQQQKNQMGQVQPTAGANTAQPAGSPQPAMA